MAKSHAEYWLQVAAHRLEIVECAKPRHLNDMAKLEAAIDQVREELHNWLRVVSFTVGKDRSEPYP